MHTVSLTWIRLFQKVSLFLKTVYIWSGDKSALMPTHSGRKAASGLKIFRKLESGRVKLAR